MPRPPSLTSTFLRAVAAVLDGLSAGGAGLNGSLALLLGVAVTASASFGRRVEALAATVAFSGLLALGAGKLRGWLLAVSAALLSSAAVSAPALLGLLPARGPPVWLFVARATASASALTAFFGLLGWRGLVEGLRGLGLGYLGEELALTLRFTPLFAWRALRLLSAREARVLARSRRASWAVATSVAGSILAAAYRKARAVRLAYEARSFGARGGGRRPRVGAGDALLAVAAALLVCALLVG